MPRNGKQTGTANFYNGVKRRLLSLALLALLMQATIPYFATGCPVYSAAATTVKSSAVSGHQTMADCPMMAPAQHAALPRGPGEDGHQHKAHAYCPLCAALSPLNAYVAAGLIALPPPSPAAASTFSIASSWSLPQAQRSAFRARAPPLRG